MTRHGLSAVGVRPSASREPRERIELCLAEHDRRMAGYDKRLLRPGFVPRMARFALRFLKK